MNYNEYLEEGTRKVKALEYLESAFNQSRRFINEKITLKYDPENERVYIYRKGLKQQQINVSLDSVAAMIHDVEEAIYHEYF